MAKYFINDIEYANLSAARNEAKKLSKDGEIVIIKNADTTDKAWYQNGVEIEPTVPTVDETPDNEAVEDTAEENVVVNDSTSDEADIAYRVLLVDKKTGSKSFLISAPAVGGYYKSAEEAHNSAESFISMTKLRDRFEVTVVPEKFPKINQ